MADAWVKNAAGVKDGGDCYRTIGGVRWLWWPVDAAVFKGAGVRHRKAPDGQGTFIHPADDDKAQEATARFYARLQEQRRATLHQHGAGTGGEA